MNTTAGTKSAAQLVAPFKRAAKMPVRSIVILIVAVAILVLDLILSQRLLVSVSGELIKVFMLAVSSISVLRDFGAAKRSFSDGKKDIWARLATVVSAVFLSLTAVNVGARLGPDWATDVLLLAASLIRLHSPRRSFHVPVLLSIGVVAAACIAIRAIPGGEEAVQYAGTLAEQIAPFLTHTTETVVEFIKEGWSM